MLANIQKAVMRILRQLIGYFRARKPARAGGYGREVLFAGWVELPAAIREIIRRR